MEELNSTKEKCLYVGDSPSDMITAQNANMKGVGVTWGFRDEDLLRESGADFIIKSPKELLEIL